MAQRKFITFLLTLLPLGSLANPWLPSPGHYKYYFNFGRHYPANSIKYENQGYYAIERKISLLNKAIYDITLQASLRKELANTDEDRRRIDIFVKHRIEEINGLISNLKNYQQYLLVNYNLFELGSGIEYGLRENFSCGVTGNLNRMKLPHGAEDNFKLFGLFAKFKILDKNRYVLTLQPKVLFDEFGQRVEFGAMLGHSKPILKENSYGQIERFEYAVAGVTRPIGNPYVRSSLGYHAETNFGVKFKDNTILMLQAINDITPGLGKIYSNVLRKQVTIAHGVNINNAKVSLSLVFFNVDSLRAGRHITSGYSVGLWIEN